MSAETNQVSSYRDLLELLESESVLHQARPNERMVQIPTQRGQLDGFMLIRWQEEDAVIQFIQSLPLPVPAEKYPTVESALVRLNHALAIPGFDLNHEHGLLAYRLTLPLYPRGSVHPAEIQAMFRVGVKTASDFLPTLRRIITGESSPETIVADAQRDMAAAAAAAQAAEASGAQAAQNPETPPAPEAPAPATPAAAPAAAPTEAAQTPAATTDAATTDTAQTASEAAPAPTPAAAQSESEPAPAAPTNTNPLDMY